MTSIEQAMYVAIIVLVFVNCGMYAAIRKARRDIEQLQQQWFVLQFPKLAEAMKLPTESIMHEWGRDPNRSMGDRMMG